MRVVRVPGVIWETAGSRVVLVEPTGEEIITLNPIGSLVWQSLGASETVADVVATVHAAHEDVPLERITADVHAFVAQLADAGLVELDAER
jgi:hypothetical protein